MIIRSFAVASFIVGQGVRPLGVEFHGAGTMFVFDDDAATPALLKYHASKTLLEEMIAKKTAVAR